MLFVAAADGRLEIDDRAESTVLHLSVGPNDEEAFYRIDLQKGCWHEEEGERPGVGRSSRGPWAAVEYGKLQRLLFFY